MLRKKYYTKKHSLFLLNIFLVIYFHNTFLLQMLPRYEFNLDPSIIQDYDCLFWLSVLKFKIKSRLVHKNPFGDLLYKLKKIVYSNKSAVH